MAKWYAFRNMFHLQQDYTTGPLQWSYFNGRSSYPISTLSPPYVNAVAMAMCELMKRGQHKDVQLLMTVLAAHGNPLCPSPDVLRRSLVKVQPDDFLPLLHKLHVCSSNCEDKIIINQDELKILKKQPNSYFVQHKGDQGSRNNDDGVTGSHNGTKYNIRYVTSLQNQARRVVRNSMMKSGRNVLWAVQRLHCPPALKSLITLKDIDRVYT